MYSIIIVKREPSNLEAIKFDVPRLKLQNDSDKKHPLNNSSVEHQDMFHLIICLISLKRKSQGKGLRSNSRPI